MKKLILVVYCMVSFNSLCYREPGYNECSDCHITYGKVKIKGQLSSADSVFRVGDTLRFLAEVPAILSATEVGYSYTDSQKVYVKNIDTKGINRFNIRLEPNTFILRSGSNPIFKDNLVSLPVSAQLVVYHKNAYDIGWSYATNSFECYYVFEQPGRYTLSENYASEFYIIDKDDKTWRFHPQVVFVDKQGRPLPRRFEHFLSPVKSEHRQQALKNIYGENWYYFEVLP